MEDEIWVAEITTKLSGIIFKKALLDQNFDGVYLKVFEGLMSKTFIDEMNVLEIFGDIGG